MDVAIDHHGAPDQAVVLQPADGDGDIVDRAEAFAVRGKCMVETAAEIEADAFLEREPRRQNGAPGRQPESFHHASSSTGSPGAGSRDR